MRPLRVDLHGFTVFREPTTIDLTDADFFALVGPTGSGKSTVLDAICFALYGTVPRWGDRRRIENALAPSAAEARVRLVFESSGARFVATRVVRRDAKGRVSTSHAGLEQLPAGFDLSTFDQAPADRDTELGTVLAGTPAEMDAAVEAAVGLPYEQFTSCVVLPQGEFATFLHAKPAQRQEILINLLGLRVYERIGARAGAAQKEAEAAATATRNLLGDVSDADDAALAAAEGTLAAARELVDAVDAAVPSLAAANEAGHAAQQRLVALETEIGRLSGVTVPRGVSTLANDASAALTAAERATEATHAAEEREEKLRAELTALGDRAALSRILDAHAERASLAARVSELAATAKTAAANHKKAATALNAATTALTTATKAVTEATSAVERAQTADRAGTLRAHLVAGQPCPVCEQPVATVPAMSAPAFAAAKTALAKAEKAAAAAQVEHDRRDRAQRDLDRAFAAATAQHGESAQRLATMDTTLAGWPTVAAAQADLTAVTAHEERVVAATAAVRSARQEARIRTDAAKAADDQLRRAWQGFDAARDALAMFGPPGADRDDLVAAWQTLHNWAADQATSRAQERTQLLDAAERALTAISAEVDRLAGLFAAAGGLAGSGRNGPGGTDPAAYRQAAALAAQRAQAALDRVLERREQAARLADQVAEHDRAAQVAKALAQHLRADRFERWLLTEALDALVTGASLILRELSSGQYDLAHEKGDFYVIDHADASLRRPVRTLSGGETFQASLALALALSEQLAGLSATATSLETIILDEGFGTLDASTLDVVAATLENLAARGDRTVGVVTHVAALAERVPVRFEVSRDARGAAHIVRVG